MRAYRRNEGGWSEQSRISQRMLSAAELQDRAAVFAALGDATRLRLLATLAAASPRSISQLAHGSHLTRQAISKHLRVLEAAGIVCGLRIGRENRFHVQLERLNDVKAYLAQIADTKHC
jgi:DNA-binding transcriptional ArsR family regulator